MIRLVVSIVALLAATVASAEPKVSGGSTPPASGSSSTQPAAPDKATPPAPGRSEAARKALGALKGSKPQEKRDDRKPGGR